MPEGENNRKLAITCSLFNFENCICHLLWLGQLDILAFFLAFCGKPETWTLPEIKKPAFFTQMNHYEYRSAGYLAILP